MGYAWRRGGSGASHGLTAFAIALLVTAGVFGADVKPQVDFTRDVHPILSDKCFHCHGPDAKDRQADMRLDVWQTHGDISGGRSGIDARQAGRKRVDPRITAEDPDDRMPPADSGKSLTPEQIETLRPWVAGGVYKKHWAFVPPERPPVPSVKNAGWVQNPIDAFVLARLERGGLSRRPSEGPDDAASPAVARPDRAAADAGRSGCVSGRQIKASGLWRQVERLLASPHYGERWGRVWLDAARYADSDGFEKDKPRFVWMYRDWVINAFNDDMPYNEFIIDQIAGDLLPNPTQDQVVATGFLRNSMINEEGGIDPEQFRMEAMFDRMDAIGKGVLGLTIQCAQCHTPQVRSADANRILSDVRVPQ